MRHQKLSVNELTVGNIIGGGMVSEEKVIYLDPTNGSDGNDGLAITGAVKTFTEAAARMVNSRQNAIVYIAGTSGITQTAAYFWTTTGLTGGTALNHTKLMGINSGNLYGARSRFFQGAYATYGAISPMFTVAGTGNYFSDLYWSGGNGGADNHNVVTVSGTYNRFDRCNFAGPLHATEGADTDWRTLIVTGGANMFSGCIIGLDTASMSAANALLSFGAAGANHPCTIFEDCMFLMQANATTPLFLIDAGTTGQGSGSLFRRCSFVNVRGQATSLSYAITWAEVGGGLQHVFHDCDFVGVSNIIATANVSRAVFTARGETAAKIGISQQTTE